jgi:cytochrome bd-type quinol oxidase subunit 2
MDYKNLGIIVMKTEQEIKEKIKELAEEGSLVSFICAMMLCWVLDVNDDKLSEFRNKMVDGLKIISDYVTSME